MGFETNTNRPRAWEVFLKFTVCLVPWELELDLEFSSFLLPSEEPKRSPEFSSYEFWCDHLAVVVDVEASLWVGVAELLWVGSTRAIPSELLVASTVARIPPDTDPIVSGVAVWCKSADHCAFHGIGLGLW
mgnify:CR=1 FL=1